MLLGEPRHGRAPWEGALAAPLVPVGHRGWAGTPQRLECPGRLLTLACGHIVPTHAFERAVGVRVLGRGRDAPAPQVPTEGLQQWPPKHAALVTDDALGHHLPPAHGTTQGGHRGARINVVEEITQDRAARLVVEERHLRELPPGRLVKDFFQTVAMPETLRVMAGVETPGGGRWGRRLGLP